MNKLYYIVCDDKETNVFEGRYQGRTRGEALKFLKQTIGRKTLNGLVFTITEIPVPLIREIVAEILAVKDEQSVRQATNVVPLAQPAPEVKPERYDAFAGTEKSQAKTAKTKAPKALVKSPKPSMKSCNPGYGDEFWSQVRAYWQGCRSLMKTARQFKLSPNTLKTRSRREGWGK
jgi:hypothetical protein